MKWLTICVLTLATSATTRADPPAHRLVLAGAVLTAAGAAMTIAGVSLVTYGELNPPPPIAVVQPGLCATDRCGSFPAPSNWPVATGAPLLAIGAAALGSGITLVVVGKRREQRL